MLSTDIINLIKLDYIESYNDDKREHINKFGDVLWEIGVENTHSYASTGGSYLTRLNLHRIKIKNHIDRIIYEWEEERKAYSDPKPLCSTLVMYTFEKKDDIWEKIYIYSPTTDMILYDDEKKTIRLVHSKQVGKYSSQNPFFYESFNDLPLDQGYKLFYKLIKEARSNSVPTKYYDPDFDYKLNKFKGNST
jgi:hypothetical protein